MKKYIFLLAVVMLFVGVRAQATVGGATYIYDLKYNPQDSSLYYTHISESGRGCPPGLSKISLTTMAKSEVVSCNQTESFSNSDLVKEEIVIITQDFKDLTPINLSDNEISIDVDFVQEEKIDESDWVIRSRFTATVFQNGVEITQFPIYGCSKDQPFTFGGYAVPGLNKKFVLLLSTKGDCFEGGYIYESLQIINGEVLDRTFAGNSYKTYGPLVPSEATLVVFEKQSLTSPTPTPSQSISYSPTASPQAEDAAQNNNSQLLTAIIAAAFLLIGVILGYLVRRI